jgi:hypothetical protein
LLCPGCWSICFSNHFEDPGRLDSSTQCGTSGAEDAMMEERGEMGRGEEGAKEREEE